MKELHLTNFKAHKELKIPFNEKNFLLYGDNGAGKSSIYEAFKIIFYNERLERAVKQQFTEEEQEEKIKEFYREFDNKILPIQDFEIKINDTDHLSFLSPDYQVYMLNLEDISFGETLKLNDLLKKVFFYLPPNHENNFQVIQSKTNAFLESCLEDIKIEIDSSDDYAIKIKNEVRNIPNTKEIKKYFNEGKINLVILALLFSAIEVTKDDSKKNVLILDDFITSLDMANRTFLMRHILETFQNFQIVILTHNVYFYNLIMYLINDKICVTDKEWQFANLYEIGNEHKIYINSNYISVDKIEEDYKKPSPNLVEIGNKLRQKFERLLYEFSKILMIGGVEESNKILEDILDSQDIYLFKYKVGSGKNKKTKFKNANHLVNEIQINTNNIQAQIDSYKLNDFPQIQEILKTLKLYRKVTMHSLSHGQTGQHNWSDKEIKQTLILLKKLETNIKDLTGNSVN